MLIYQVAVGEVPPFYETCIASGAAYAQRIGAEHIVKREPILKIAPLKSARSENALRLGYLPIYEKEVAFGYLDRHERIAIIDADIYVRPTAPNLFDELRATFAAVVERDMPNTEVYADQVRKHSEGQFRPLTSRMFANAPTVRFTSPAEGFETSELAPFMVKGKAKPVHAWAVGPRIGRPKHTAAQEYPVVGREEELRLLTEAWEAARADRRRTVVLRGEAGLGKTRLLDEVLEKGTDFAVFGATGEAFTSTTPYVAWRDVLREVIGVSWDDPSEAVVARLRALAEERDPSLLPWLPLIAAAGDGQFALDKRTEIRGQRGEVIATIENLAVTLDGDPAVNLQFAVTAGAFPTTFTITSGIVGFAPLSSPNVFASVGITLTDNTTFPGDGASIGPIVPNLFKTFYNGGTPFIDILSGFGFPSSGSLTSSTSSGLLTIPGTVVDINSGFSFTLSPDDQASGTSKYEIIPVPEHNSLILLIIGLVGMRLRRTK